MQRLNLKKFAASIALGLLTALAVTVVQATPLLLIADPIAETPAPYWQVNSLDDLKVGVVLPMVSQGKATLLCSPSWPDTPSLQELAKEKGIHLLEMTPNWLIKQGIQPPLRREFPPIILLLDANGMIRLRQAGAWTEEHWLLLKERIAESSKGL